MKIKAKLKKFLVAVSLLSILIQSAGFNFYAVKALADDTTPTPTVSQDNSTPSDSPTPTPLQDSVTPTPKVLVTPTDTATPAPTDNPENTVTPTPVTVDNLSPPPSDNSTAGGQSESSNLSPVPTSIETSNTTSDNSGKETLSAVILENVSAPSLDLQAPTSQGSATLTTDKADYAATDTALISGSNLDPNTNYTLGITSSDEPPVNFETQVTSDENGTFIYAYQLDGNYRPNYSVELKDSTGAVVATTTFTDTLVIGCTTDAQGANDEPGQKDLTKMCVNSASSTDLGISWNWDDTSFSGNNTGDACSLYDANNDGLADYTLCVGVNGNPASNVYTTLYSCGNGSSEKCTQPILQINSFSSTCSASVVSGSNPFDLGSDTVASCSVNLSDVGGGSTNLLDVCSFPSGQPNSDPSDCIVASTAAQTGTLTVTKVLSPSGDSGLFNLNIDSNTFATDIGNNGATGPKVVDTGTHTASESAGTNTSLSNYNSGVVCRDNSNNNIIVQGSGTSLQVTIANNQNVTCTITNTRINNASITIVKDAQPNDAQDFAFTATGSGLTNFSLDDDSDLTLSNTKAFSSLAAGTYSVAEGAVTGWTSDGGVCSDGSPVSAIVLSAGENVTCTFTNTRDTGKLELQKDFVGTPENVTIKIGATQNASDIDSDVLSGDGTDGEHSLNTGNYFVSETLTTPSNYTSGLACYNDINNSNTVDGGDTVHAVNTSTGQVSVGKNDDVICVFTNTRNTGSVLVNKLVDANGNGTFEGGNTEANNLGFDWGLDSETPARDMGTTASGVNTGNHSANEDSVSGYHFVGWYLTSDTSKTCANTTNTTLPASISVTTGQTTNVTLCNAHDTGTIELKKVWSGTAGQTTLNIGTTVGDDDVDNQLTGANGSAPLTTGQNIVPTGTYYVSETGGLTNYDSALACTDNGDSVTPGPNNSLSVTTGHAIVCTFTNTRDQGKIELQKDFVGTDENVTIKIGTTQNGFQVDSDVLSADGTDGEHTVDTGTFYVSETLTTPANYTSGLACYNDVNDNDAIDGGDTAHTVNTSTGEVAVGQNDDVICVFTNTRNQGTITFEKIVDGGTASPEDWTFTVNGNDYQGGGSYTFDTGDYPLTESGPDGYTLTDASGVCSLDQAGNVTVSVTTEGGTCTITNTRDTGDLRVIKVVDDESDLTNWSFTLDDGNPVAADSNGDVDFGQVTTLDNHTITESGPDGYHFVSVTGENCTDNQDGTATATVDKDGTTTCTFTNNINKGTITVRKDIIGTKTDLTQFCFTLNPDPGIREICADENGDAVFDDVPFGTYSADETSSASDYTEQSNDCTDLAIVNDGDSASCTVTNSRDQGTITVVKSLSPSDDPGLFNLQIDGNTVGTGENVGDGGTTGQITVDTGTYTVGEAEGTETNLSDYTTSISCVDDGGEGEEIASTDGNGTSLSDIQVNKGDDIVCTITNTRDTGTVVIHKKVDDGSGTYQTGDTGANTIGFRWGLDGGNIDRLMGTNQIITTDEKHDVDENLLSGYVFTGWYENLGEQTRFSCENPESTSTTISFTVTKDSTRSFTFCNQRLNPILTISKTNNAIGDLGPGSDVLYTITIAATQSSAQDVTVTDLLPDGFKYKGGSWTAASNVNPGLVVPEPVYASPGVWNLGNMAADETITLTLIATIDGSQHPGLYKDVAWGQGEALGGDTVLAQAQNPGFVDDNFVGTAVNVVKEDSQAPSLAKQGEVLGASTVLPATGVNTNWTLLAIAILLLGLNMVAVGFIIRKRYV